MTEQQHLEQLAKEHKLPVEWIDDPTYSGVNWGPHPTEDAPLIHLHAMVGLPYYGEWTPKGRVHVMQIPRAINDYNYAVALHEFGHTLTRSGDEVLASKWALTNGIKRTSEMEQALVHGITSHVKGIYPHQKLVEFQKWLEETRK